MYRVLLILTILLGGGAKSAAGDQTSLHRVDVDLDPVSGAIEIRDRVTLDGRVQYRYQLAPWLRLDRLRLDGAPVAAGRDGIWFVLELPSGGKHELEFEMHGTIPSRETAPRMSSSSEPDGTFLPGYDAWLPMDDTGLMRYLLTLRVGEPFRAVASGRLIGEDMPGNRYEASFSAEEPAEAPSLFAGSYRIRELRHRNLRLRSYFHAELEGLADVYLQAAAAYIDRYADVIGPYPYSDFHMVSAPLPVGLGFPNLTYVGREVLPLPFMRGRSLAHELVHNWWGNGVRIDYASGNWAEGLTTYMADYALARDAGEDAARGMREKWLRDYAALPAARDHALRDFRSKRHQAAQVIGYNKAAFVFHMLALEIGQQAFDAGLRRLWQTRKFTSAGWRDLQRVFEYTAGRELDWFFKQWLERQGAPRLSLGSHRVDKVAAGYRTSVEILQPIIGYRFKLPVLLATEDGSDRHEISVSETLTRLQWVTDAAPRYIQLDPDSDVFRRLQEQEAPPILRDVTLNATTATIIASSAPSFVDSARRLAFGLMDVEPKFDDLGSAISANRPLLLITRTDELGKLLSRLRLRMPPELDQTAHAAAAWTARLDIGTPALIVSADDDSELQALLRPLPHYGGQSYVLFDAGRALGSGVWPLTRGALYRELNLR